MSKPIKIKWYYYLCIHGPGHQSTTEGFCKFPDDDCHTEPNIELIIGDKLSRCDNATYWFWKVKKPPSEQITGRIKDIRDNIKSLRAELKALENNEGMELEEEKGTNETIARALEGRVLHKVVMELHKRDLYYTESQVKGWRFSTLANRTKQPAKYLRRRVLNAIRSADKYLDYRKTRKAR